LGKRSRFRKTNHFLLPQKLFQQCRRFSSKSTKLFQLWGTSHGYYPSPHDACRYHRMAFSGLIKARETPRTGAGDEKKDRNEEKKRNWEQRGRLEKQTRQKQGKRTKGKRTPASPSSSEHKHSSQTKTERLEQKNKRPETEDGRAEKPEEKTRKKNQ